MRAWLFQDHRQKRKLGGKAPWCVSWYDLEGKKRSRCVGSKTRAEKFRRKTEGELASGAYRTSCRKKWQDFRDEYAATIASRMEPGTRCCVMGALKHFERIIRPQRVDGVSRQKIDEYISRRVLERGKRKGDVVSPATINKELRHLRAVLRIAHEWSYLPVMPKISMLKEPKKLPRYVTPEHFASIYEACKFAVLPDGVFSSAADWWRALLAFAYMTGWRIGELLSLRREDLDLEAGTAITRHADNKGKRDDLVPLHPVLVNHLRKIACFEPMVLPWLHNRESLWCEFSRIQRAAGIHLACVAGHEHTPACHVYGFHDLRRAFATMNADRLSADALQALMRHKSYLTTQRYVNMARPLKRAVETLHVPDVLKSDVAGA